MQHLENTDRFQVATSDTASLPADYNSWQASQKQEFLWSDRILPSQYNQIPPLQPVDVIGLFLTSFKTKMDRHADEAPIHWQKAIHAHGSVAKIRFIPTVDSAFTGLFRGADYGLLRLSLTGAPEKRGFAPGLAIKFLVDGKPSANVSALVSLEGQGQNYNFFANELSNIVPASNHLGPKFINFLFSRVSKFPTRLHLQDWGEIQQSGQLEPHPYHPYQIFLVPDSTLHFPVSPAHDFRQDLATIAPGTVLFSVYGVKPDQMDIHRIGQPDYRQAAQLMGQIQTTSEFITSEYGDRRLFFRHQRFKNQ
jgi:hypothetical protein